MRPTTGGRRAAQAGGQGIGGNLPRRDGHGEAGQLSQGQGAAADLRRLGDDGDGRRGAEGVSQAAGEAAAAAADLFRRGGEHAQHRDLPHRLLAVEVVAQGGLQRRQGQLVDAQGARHRVAADLLHQLTPADDQSRLRPPQQLVAAEGDHVDAGGHRLAHRRLPRQAEIGQIKQHTASQILHHRQPVLAAEGSQFRRRHRGGEADDAVVAGMDLEQQTGLLADGGAVVLQVRLVGGSHLAQAHAAGRHHLRHPEGAADLHQLAARHHRLLPPGEGAQGEQHRPGVVVHGGGRLGPGQSAEKGLHVAVAMAALPRLQIEFQVGVGTGNLGHGAQCGPAQGRPPQVGVQQGAGGVDHRPQGREKLFLGQADRLRRHPGGREIEPGHGVGIAEDGQAQALHRFLGTLQQQPVRAGISELAQGRLTQDAVNGGQPPQQVLSGVHGRDDR